MKNKLLKGIVIITMMLIPFFIYADEDDKYNPEDLSDYFGTMQACTKDGSENDCRNGNEYKFYLKMYDMYFLYQKKYNVKLDLPLIMSTLYYGNEELPIVFKNNLNSYDRNAVKSGNGVTNLDWEYDFKNDPCYTYLNANDFSYDMQILAKNMVKKSITYKCSEGSNGEAEDIETSNYSNESLKCENGEYDKDSVSANYKLDLEKYDKFLLEYIKLKYHTPGTEVKSCSTSKIVSDGNYVSNVNFLTGNFGNIHYYMQGDYSQSYGGIDGATIASHGCGPTSLAIVISSITGIDHDPVEMTNYVCDHGGCTDGGTVWGNITSTARDYGLEVEETNDNQSVVNALASGKSLAIALMCPGHFTSGGHFIVLTGVTSDGKVTVADPASTDRSTAWDFNTIAEESCSSRKYWIIGPGANTIVKNNSSTSSSNLNRNKIIVGDSRVVHLCQYVGGGSWSECNVIGVKKSDVTYVPGDGKSYSWFNSTALPKIKELLKTNGNSILYLYMGTNALNDLSNQAKGYARDLNQLAKDYPNASIIAVSETPIIDKNRDSAFDKYYSDANIVKFNNQLKKQLSSSVSYCDIYSKVKGSVNASDGIHYDSSSYKKIYNEIMNCSM